MIETFTIELKGLEKRIARLQAAARRAQDLSPVWRWAHFVLLSETAQQFLTEGVHFLGRRWARIKDATYRRKVRTFGPPPPPLGVLYASGALFESLTNEAGADHVFAASAQHMVFGTRVLYAQFHQDGSVKTHLPQRKILRMTDRFKRRVFRATVQYILSGKTPPLGAAGVA